MVYTGRQSVSSLDLNLRQVPAKGCSVYNKYGSDLQTLIMQELYYNYTQHNPYLMHIMVLWH